MNYLCAIFECASIAIIVSGLENERKKTSLIKLAVYLFAYFIFFEINMHFQLAIEFSFVSYGLLLIYIKYAYKEDIFRALVITVISAVFAGVVEYLLMILISFILPAGREIGLCELIVTGMTLLISIVLARCNIYKVLDVLEKLDFIYAIVCILSLMIFAPMTIMKVFSELDIKDYCYIAVCIIVMWMLIMRMQKYKLEDKIRKEYLEAYSDVIVQIRRRQHKIENHFNVIGSMYLLYDNYEDLVKSQRTYLDKIKDYELPNDAIILEEPSVIALVYKKINEALEREIKVKTSFACSMAESRVSDIVWVDIIGTFLDNAIEALEHYDGKRIIWLDIKRNEENKTVVTVSNTFEKLTISEIHEFFNLGYSTKGDNHGVGLYNVGKIIEKQRGDFRALSVERDGLSAIMFQVTI